MLNLDWTRAKVDPSVFVADNATIIGDVTIGRDSSVWYGAVLRGDVEPITIGERTSVQDGCVLHTDPGFPVIVGSGVTVGHGAIVHGAVVEDDVIVSMGAVILSGARIGSGCIVGAGAVVTEGTTILPNSLVLGVPAKAVKSLTPEQARRIKESAEHYVRYAKEHKAEQERRLARKGQAP